MNPSTKITAVRASAVRVPVTRPAAFVSTTLTHVSSTIVEVETVGGLTGVGETRGTFSAAIINQQFAPKIVGLSAAARRDVRDACLPRQPFDYGYPERMLELHAFAGIELALWDLAGKVAGEPLFRLLGGPVRERAPFVAYAYTVHPDEGRSAAEVAETMADIAARSVAESGASMFEFKVGLHPVPSEIAIVEAVREAVGADVDLAVDANMGFGIEAARRFLDSVAEAGIANIEEPVASLAGCERLRGEFGVPVSTHCFDLDAISAYPLIDAVVSDIHLHGGIERVIDVMSRAAALSRRFWLRARWELGVSWAAMCHLGIARPELDRPAQALINWVEDDLIAGDPWLVREWRRPPARATGPRRRARPPRARPLHRAGLKRVLIARLPLTCVAQQDTIGCERVVPSQRNAGAP